MKLACVVQRYGPEVAGGSETHCRDLAERLTANHEVHVLTSTARDYLTWQEAFEAGWSTVGPVKVRRFPVAGPRKRMAFAALTERALERDASVDDQRRWFHENGPQVPELLEYLERHGREYDLVLFWTFRYYPSFFGVPMVADRAVLVPTAEEDAVVDMPILGRFFASPRGYLFLTPEERSLVESRADGALPPSLVVGTGLEPRRARTQSPVPGIDEPFLLYVGRVDPNKGCDRLFSLFTRYAEEATRPMPLVLAGPEHMPVPDHPLIRRLGYVSHERRDALLDRARALVMPSPYESLSLALLEAWNHGCPAIVNRRCSVLKGQVRRANGGVHYATYDEFFEALRLMAECPALASQLGRQGLAYIDAHYRWPGVIDRVESFLTTLSAS